MSIERQRAEALFERGHFNELAKLVEHARRKGSHVDVHALAIAAHGMALCGDTALASRLLGSPDHAASSVRALAKTVEGIVAERSGSTEEAVRQYQAAIRLGSELGPRTEVAWAHLHLFRLFAEIRPTDAEGLVPALRRAVAAAGSPSLTAYLHTSLAVLEGQRGRIVAAKRHCDIADSILGVSRNEWIAANAMLNRGCLSILACDFSVALKVLTEARAVAAAAGFNRIVTRADANIGHVQMLRGDFDRARSTLNEAASSLSSNFVRLGALENLARIELASNSLDEAFSQLQQLDEVANRTCAGSFYHVRWAGLTKARLLARRGELLDALDELVRTQQLAEAAVDRPLCSSIHLLKAEILTKQGRASAAACELFNAAVIASDVPETLPHYWYSVARVLPDKESELALQLSTRAARRWSRLGLALPSLEIAGLKEPRHAVTAKQSPSSHLTSLLTSVSGIFDLASDPRQFGEEILALVHATGLTGRMGETLAQQSEMETAGYALPLGSVGRQTLTLHIKPPDDSLAAVAAGDLIRLTRAALELRNFKQEERSRASLWPYDGSASEPTSVFVAEEMQALLATAKRIAPTTVPILITGETGTGKEVLARTIHSYSLRAAKTFLPFNCTAVPREMLDAQLFGHRRGAFTGATENFAGIIRGADGGTLFLDEIGEATLDVQPKLLRFLEAGEVHPIGETHPTKVNTRVIAATNADLDLMVAEGRFREDLFYRLNIVRMHVPPLRERRVEIPALADHYLQKHAQECNKRDLRLAEETMEYLMLYRWPGNVRQLANEMRRMAALAENGAILMPEHLSSPITASRRTIPVCERPLEAAEIVVRMDQPMSAAVDHLERAMIVRALKQTGGHMEQAADLLGLSRKGLYLKRQRFGLGASSVDAEPA